MVCGKVALGLKFPYLHSLNKGTVKQCRPWLDVSKCIVWSWSTLFSYKIGYFARKQLIYQITLFTRRAGREAKWITFHNLTTVASLIFVFMFMILSNSLRDLMTTSFLSLFWLLVCVYMKIRYNIRWMFRQMGIVIMLSFRVWNSISTQFPSHLSLGRRL